MIIFLWLMLALVPWLIGAAVQAVLHWKTSEVIHMTDSWITGSLCCIGLGEALHLLGGFGHLSLGRLHILWCDSLTVLCLLALALVTGVWLKHRERFRILPQKGGSFVLPGFFLLMVLTQVVYVYCMPAITAPGDITVETLRSFQATDGIYLVNPLTGQAYVQGMSMRYKILGLPTLYTLIGSGFPVDGGVLVQNLMSVVVLAGPIWHITASPGYYLGMICEKNICCFFWWPWFSGVGRAQSGWTVMPPCTAHGWEPPYGTWSCCPMPCLWDLRRIGVIPGPAWFCV